MKIKWMISNAKLHQIHFRFYFPRGNPTGKPTAEAICRYHPQPLHHAHYHHHHHPAHAQPHHHAHPHDNTHHRPPPPPPFHHQVAAQFQTQLILTLIMITKNLIMVTKFLITIMSRIMFRRLSEAAAQFQGQLTLEQLGAVLKVHRHRHCHRHCHRHHHKHQQNVCVWLPPNTKTPQLSQ